MIFSGDEDYGDEITSGPVADSEEDYYDPAEDWYDDEEGDEGGY